MQFGLAMPVVLYDPMGQMVTLFVVDPAGQANPAWHGPLQFDVDNALALP